MCRGSSKVSTSMILQRKKKKKLNKLVTFFKDINPFDCSYFNLYHVVVNMASVLGKEPSNRIGDVFYRSVSWRIAKNSKPTIILQEPLEIELIVSLFLENAD